MGDRFEERVEGWLEEPPWEGETWDREFRDQGQDRPARATPDDEEMGDWPEQPQDRRRPRSRDYGSNDSDLDPWI